MNAEELATILNNAVAGASKAFERLAQAMRGLSMNGNIPTYTLLPSEKARRRRHIVNALNRTRR